MANKKKEDFSVKETKPSIRAKKPLNGPTTSFDLVEEMLYLYVRTEKAKLEPVHSLLQVELKIGNYRGNTSHAPKSPEGEFLWHRVFAFTKSSLQDTSVQVLVKSVGGVVIGKRSFGVSEALKRVPPDPPLAAQWYPLVDPQGDSNIVGELMMAFWTGTQADDAYNLASHSDVAAPLSPEGLLSIRPKVHLIPRFWYLRVNVIAAQDLMIPDINDREQAAQIFVKASVLMNHQDNNVLRCDLTTKSCLTKTRDAKWNEDLMFVVAEPFDVPLYVAVFELLRRDATHPTDQGEERLLGYCEIPVKTVGKRNDTSPATILWKDLKVMESQGTNARFASKINMRISLDGGYHVFDEPTEFSSDRRPSAKVLWKSPVGVFELGIMSASGLSQVNPKTTVDTYCVAKYGPKWVRTRTVIDNCSPKWNEQYSWEIYDHCTVITIAVFENNKYMHKGGERLPDWGIGKVRIRLSELELDKVYTNSHPLVKLEPHGVKKTGELQLSYRFSSPSTFNVYSSYLEPLWPKLHYKLPLSVHQISKLKDQAIKLTVSKLKKAEPPLSEEVVRYVLEDNKFRFSLRRARANFIRCAKLLNSFSFCKQQFDRLRNWTNMMHTIIFIICLNLVYFFPAMALSSMFFMLCGLGAWGYRTRPRQLPHIDTELSQVYSVLPDEIAEEFDSFPTRVPREIVVDRYYRLAKIIFNAQTMLGDIATIGERVQSMLSWRDKRATFFVLIFFFTAGVLFYAIPWSLGLVYVLTIAYVFLHPRFRIDLPSYFQNFIARLPSNMDSML
ncbi:FT-interacting protein 3-like [Argentina anserina]|uniref:FT-interacting protein 3-like n=1 Tax=Argentina anserina TaxID=57926 RepID=UPI00217667E7|nr:FT-interacting protein 3-like [Potentilla anserina]